MECSNCGKEFELNHFNQKLCSDVCKKESRAKTLKNHKKTDKWKESNKRWVNSEKRIENEKGYRQEPKAKRLAVIRSKRCLSNSPELQEAKRKRDNKFSRSDEGKAINKISRKKYMQTDKGKISQINGKARRRQLERKGKITAKEWAEKLKEFDYCCSNCGIDEDIEMDHIIPLSKCGEHSIENIQPLCRSCNASKGAKLEWVG